VEKYEEKERGGQRKVCCGSKGDWSDCEAMIVQEEQERG
jgi:hypothetical protein